MYENAPPQPKWRPLLDFYVIRFQAESDIAAKEKNAEQLQDELAAQDESISKLSKEKKNLEEAKQVSNAENIGQTGESERESEVCEGPKISLSSLPIFLEWNIQ